MIKIQKTHLADHGQDPGLRVVVSVRADSEIDLLVGFVQAKCFGETEERVLRRLGDDPSSEDGRAVGTHEVRGDGEETVSSDGSGGSGRGGGGGGVVDVRGRGVRLGRWGSSQSLELGSVRVQWGHGQ